MDFVRSVLLVLCISAFGAGTASATGTLAGIGGLHDEPASAASARGASPVASLRKSPLSTLATSQTGTTRYGPPYTHHGYGDFGPFPTIPIAIQHWYANWQANWPAYAYCTFTTTYTSPTSANGGQVAGMLLQSPCGGGNGIFATAYTYSPAKNLGKPCSCAGDPIDLATGNEYRDDEDLSLGSLSLHRYYNSHKAIASTYIGAHWRHSFDRSLEYLTSSSYSTVTAFRSDGVQVSFVLTSGQWVADSDVPDRLTEQTGASGNLTGWVYFDAATRNQEAYDAGGNLLSITDPQGQVTTLAYSTTLTAPSIAPSAGLLLTVTDPHGRQLNFTYNSNAQLTTVTEPDGSALSYTYDTHGNLASVTYPGGTSRQYVYDESSLTNGTNLPNALTGDIDESGTRFTSIGYNASGQATMSMLATNIDKTQVTYNSASTTSVTYPTGAQATLDFVTPNGSMHTSSVSAPCGAACGQPNAAATFDSNGYPSSTTDWNGNVTVTTYDANGLLDEEVDAQGTGNQRTTTTTWNTTLRVPLTRVVQNAAGATVSSTQWVYNSAGQILARCAIDPTNSAASGYNCATTGTVPAGVRRWTSTYCTAVDGTQCPIVGLLLSSTGPRTDLTQTTTYSYYLDSATNGCPTLGGACHQPGDLYQITDPLGHVTTYASYDADGRPTRITGANGINTDLTYTPRGWLASRSVGGATTTFGYTPYGAVSSVTDPDGVTTTYGYDAAHRLVKVTDAQGNYVQYTLDGAGNKTAEQVVDMSGTVHRSLGRTFNALGQLTTVVDGLNHAVFNASIAGSYDADGNLVQSSDGLGIQRQQSYDALNRLVQTIDNYNGTN